MLNWFWFPFWERVFFPRPLTFVSFFCRESQKDTRDFLGGSDA